MSGTCYTSAQRRLSRQREKVAVNSTISYLLVTKQDKGKHSLRLNYRNADNFGQKKGNKKEFSDNFKE
ncbi:hypothetical protein LFZ92_19110 [Salmonella enterica subsp. salamae serovar 57:z29:z42]|nr:hypothetical protein LFZ92_19110 [Salmonella enterica subsp. salamae serovar 57:z29:z42]ECI0412073.1 hypothetical protein [Salmonella enterica subsp. salamae]